ncbi:MAG: DUF134 domain-containing protein [Tissierellia bacterium]|nr:DUF134 domain-containing protein [Tissierellia bacterium]
MSRPVKGRNVCSLPKVNKFGPLGHGHAAIEGKVMMSVDEYETIRLIDLEGLKQEECAQNMGVSRTTVQGIYTRAREKLADALVHGKALVIEGGEYELCDGFSRCGRGCTRGGRHRQRGNQE